MKIGIITDVHNNVIALNSMLAVFEEEGCDEIICCGDIIGIGPFPEETVQRIKSLPNIRCVLRKEIDDNPQQVASVFKTWLDKENR